MEKELMKKLVLVCLFLITFISIMPNTIALFDYKSEEINGQINSGFMIGIMHIHFEKKGWGWIEIWQPIIIYNFRLNTRELLGPISGNFMPHGFNGLIGAQYFIHRHFLDSGYFFICARVEVF
jgi:hypothetical protein